MVESKIVHLLTGKHDLHDVSIDELKRIAEQRPYFSIAQLLLAKKMKMEDHPEFLQQVQRTALYFPNTHWLHYQLNNGFDQHNNEMITRDQAVEERVAIEDRPVIEEIPTTRYEEPVIKAIEPVGSTTEETVSHEEKIDTDGTQEEDQAEVIAPTLEQWNNEQGPDDVMETTSQQEEGMDDDAYDTSADADVSVPSDEASSKLADMIQQQMEAFKAPVEEDAKLPIETEPYHTVDYFASQGIKLSAAQLEQDQLGSKVRKFTDWLKQMKRVQPIPQDLGTDPELETVVQDIAATSNEAREIVTEAMAEVLIKQGKHQKAIKLYEKLSFLYPDRTAYFAAKIKELKEA